MVVERVMKQVESLHKLRVVNRNPTLENWGEGWFPQSGTEKFGLTIQKTKPLKRGFEHEVILIPLFGITASTWTEAGIGEPYEHPNPVNPEPWELDVPLKPACEHEFYFESLIKKWKLNPRGYLSTGFGGWITLPKPYRISGYTKFPSHRKVGYKSRLLEVMFGIRNEQFGEKMKPGGKDWHRVVWRSGLRFDTSTAWFIFQYILDQAEVGERRVHHLDSETFSALIEALEDGQPWEERSVIGEVSHNLQGMVYCMNPVLSDLDLSGAKFRIGYLYLEGMVDIGAMIPSRARVEHYGIYHCHRRYGRRLAGS